VDAGLFRSIRPVGPFDPPEELAGDALEGPVAEHLRTWVAYANTRDTLSYWRKRSGSEVDFVPYGESGLYRGRRVLDSTSLACPATRSCAPSPPGSPFQAFLDCA
jgi:hypothetical protein